MSSEVTITPSFKEPKLCCCEEWSGGSNFSWMKQDAGKGCHSSQSQRWFIWVQWHSGADVPELKKKHYSTIQERWKSLKRDRRWLRRHRLPGEIQCRQSGKLQSQSYCIFFRPAIWQLKQFMAVPKTQQQSNLIHLWVVWFWFSLIPATNNQWKWSSLNP